MILIQRTELEKNLDAIDDFISVKIDVDDPVLIKGLLADTVSFLATSTKLQSSCKFWLETSRKEVFGNKTVQNSLFKLSSSLQKQLVDSYLANELSMYELSQRQNAFLTHSLEALRSLLSFAKSEMELSKHSRT
jgi:hypothetical protein